jgi:diadenylate cyclase
MAILHYWKIILEIALLWYFIYMALYFIKGTRTEQLVKGIVVIGLIFVLAQQLGLDAIIWVLTRLFPISVIALVVIFQPELRRGLTRLGQLGVHQEDIEVIEEIAESVLELSRKGMGALIAIERKVGLKTYIETGTAIDSKVTKELLASIFAPQAPLHDGAVIIQGNRIIAAGCLLPLTQETNLSRDLGTRHRAAIGLTEETDAICIAVSEETGAISIASGGRLTRGLEGEHFTRTLKNIFYRRKRVKGISFRALANILPRIAEKED